MSVYVALLRAVNVGSRKLAMADLRRVVEEVGGTDPQTYLQSGNVVFRGTKKAATALAPALTSLCGFEVRVLLRTAAELRRVVEAQPLKGPESAWHVTFLEAAPARAAAAAIDPSAYGADSFRIVGRAVYLRVPDGYGRTKLNNSLFERKLTVAATTRNWRTVTALATLCAP